MCLYLGPAGQDSWMPVASWGLSVTTKRGTGCQDLGICSSQTADWERGHVLSLLSTAAGRESKRAPGRQEAAQLEAMGLGEGVRHAETVLRCHVGYTSWGSRLGRPLRQL